MNITILTNNFKFGGAQKMHVFLANSLLEKGHNVSYINLSEDDEVFYNLNERIIIRTYGKKSESNPLRNNYRWFSFVRGCIKEFKSDVLIGFNPECNFWAVVAGRLLRIPSIIAERTDPFTDYKGASRGMLMKIRCANLATGAVFQTKGASEYYAGRLQRRAEIIPNPIFVEERLPEIDYANRPKTVVFLGRFFNRQKRLDVLVRTFAKFHETHPEYRLIVYGGGQDEAFLIDNISKAGISECVDIKGKTSTPMLSLAKEGIYISTSDYEGISNSVLEAMAVGLPVVTTDHSPGGARFLIQDHENGILAPCGDVEALAKALSEFADSNELAEKCGRNAKKVQDTFKPEYCVEAWGKYINSVVTKYGKKS